jgi:2-isopropylmalate synthase
MIESADQHDSWGTVGVSENIIEASWIALVDAFEYKLYKDQAERDLPAAEGGPASIALTSSPTAN